MTMMREILATTHTVIQAAVSEKAAHYYIILHTFKIIHISHYLQTTRPTFHVCAYIFYLITLII